MVTLLASSAAAGEPAYARGPTRASMQAIFAQLQEVLPLSVEPQVFRDPANAERIRKALGKLAELAEGLDGHGEGLDPGALFLGRSLERDARRALDQYERGSFDSAGFFVGQLTESCIGCHSRLKSPGDAPIARGFAERADFDSLDPVSRARLQIATRRFEAALKTLEEALASPHYSPWELLGPITDYLTLCVRVVDDPARPVPVLARFALRDDLWVALRGDVDAWGEALVDLAGRAPGGHPVARARALIDEGRSRILYPSDRRALVHYAFASRLLHEYVATHRERGDELARAYYLLGVAESRIGRGFWVSQADFYLEMAIRMAPTSATGREAYALLEEETLSGYTGSSGLNLPPDVEQHLRELRELIEPPAPRRL